MAAALQIFGKAVGSRKSSSGSTERGWGCCVRAVHRTRVGGLRSIHGPGGEESVFHTVALLDQGWQGQPQSPQPLPWQQELKLSQEMLS